MEPDMRMRGVTLTVAAVLASAAAMAVSASASAATTTCTNAGTIKLSPGLEGTAKVQNITIKGTLSECKGEGSTATGGTYVAHLKTTEPVSCSALTGSAPAEGTIVVKWTPKGEGNSKGTFTMPLTELPTTLGGKIESGPFAEGAISGTVTQKYTGGASCGVANGKKKAKKVNKGTLSGTLTIS